MRYQAAALPNIVMQKLFKRQQTSSATLQTNPCAQLSAQATTNCVPARTTASETTLQQLVSVHMQQCIWEAAQKGGQKPAVALEFQVDIEQAFSDQKPTTVAPASAP